MTQPETVAALLAELEGAAAEDVLADAAKRFPGRVAFASSLGLEDQVLTAMIAEAKLDIPIFTLDTGRLYPETYDLIARTKQALRRHHPRLLPRRRRGRGDGRPRRRQPLPRQHRGAQALLRDPQGQAAAARADRARRLDLRPAQRPGRDPPEGRGGRVGRRRRPRQDQPAGGVGRSGRVELRPRPRRALQPAARRRLPQHRLRAVHARRAGGRGRPLRALVVGERRAPRVRAAPPPGPKGAAS